MTRRYTLDNPIINSPFVAPARHFRFTSTGISNAIVGGRRCNIRLISIPKPWR